MKIYFERWCTNLWNMVCSC